MADDLKIGLRDIASKTTESELLEKVEQAYEEFRDYDVEDFGGLGGFGFDTGTDDLWGL